MAHRDLTRAPANRAVVSLLLVIGVMGGATAACGASATQESAAKSASEKEAAARPPPFATDDASWGRFHSKRFQLSLPLPDGRAWKIDDHSRGELVAIHEPTSSRVTVLVTQEEELMNRQRCEARARELGHVPNAPLTTVDDEATLGPDAYDSRVWVALDAGRPGGAVGGHVFLFGAFLRRCLLIHVATEVPSSKDDDVLSSRLAIARGRIVRGVAIDPPRTMDNATVPRDRPEIRR